MKIRLTKTISILTITTLLLFFNSILAFGQKSIQVIGPLIGHTDTNSTIIWARINSEGQYTLDVKKISEKKWKKFNAESQKVNDYCVKWHVVDLESSSYYNYRIKKGKTIVDEGDNLHFKTAPVISSKSRVSIAFGSGSSYVKGTSEVWNRIGKSNIDGIVLLGDTPYIDATELSTQREKYKEFSNFSAFKNLTQSIPFWGTWDDHDFAYNDSDGTAKGKENSLKVFKEYRPNASFGDGNEGIYTKFSYGATEVFILDTRWWSWTTSSYADSTKKTLLGKTQWEWLKKSLVESKATFKLIACGMIWDDKENGEKDDWGTYMHERDALFQFIGDQKISGVVLIGGDIHVSRVLRYNTEKQIGYPLYQFITSPLHQRTIKSLNVPHPNLIRDAVIPHTFMKITADETVEPATLRAEFIDKNGKRLFDDISITIDQLSPK